MGHRTPQLGTRTYYKIHALCKIFALHKIFVLGNFSFFFVFFSFFFSFFFFVAKIAWNHVFWNMGKVAVFRETSVVAHTIAFQAILAKKKKRKKKLSRVKCDNFLVYDGKKLVLDSWGRSKGATHTVFIFAFQKISALQGWHRTLSVELFCTEENRIVDDLCSQILLCRALCGATKMSRKMGMALLMKGQPSVPEHKLKAYELGFWDREKCRWQISIRTLLIHFWKAQHF